MSPVLPQGKLKIIRRSAPLVAAGSVLFLSDTDTLKSKNLTRWV